MGATGFVGEGRERWARTVRSVPEGMRRFAGALSVTLLGQVFLLCGLFLITRISAMIFAPTGFGEYQVARRTLAVVALPLLCGLGISLPRYLARDIADRDAVGKWMVSAACLGVGLICVFVAIGTALSGEIGRLIFGRNSRDPLTFALLLAIVGMFGATLAVAAMRGLSRFRNAAALQVVNGALVPLAGVILCGGRVERAFYISGVLWIAIALGIFTALAREWADRSSSFEMIGKGISELFVYGAPRVPGDIALFGLFALPAYAAVHRNDMLGAGFVSVGLSLVQAVATMFASTGFILLPSWSRAARSVDELNIAKRRIGKLLAASVVVATLSMGLLQLFLYPVVHLLLGRLANTGTQQIRYMLIGSIPYVVYLVLRDYFDAISIFPLNTLALTATIGIQWILLSADRLSITSATVLSFLALGLLMTLLWGISLSPSGAKWFGYKVRSTSAPFQTF